MASEDPEWADLDVETIKAVVRCGAAFYVFAATQDDTLQRYFSDWLDVRPSDVASAVLDAYREAFLSPAEARLATTMMTKRNAEDAVGYSMAIGRMMWMAGGGEGTPPITVVMQWRTALNSLRETFGQHFTAELERFARE
jgi:hypothetical protein